MLETLQGKVVIIEQSELTLELNWKQVRRHTYHQVEINNQRNILIAVLRLVSSGLLEFSFSFCQRTQN